MQRRTRGHGAEFVRSDKPVEWRGTAYRDLCAFPEAVRREAGFQLGLLQAGEEPDDWKPMSTVGPGTIEIRIHGRMEHRVFVVAKFEEAIYVLDAFDKKSEKTPPGVIARAKRRYRDLMIERRRR
jgi:phage-related protein